MSEASAALRRRELLIAGGSFVATSLFPACAAQPEDPTPPAPHIANVIDSHCHIFNGSDLPTVRFLKIVVLTHYPRQAVRTLDITDPDAVDGLLALLTYILGRTRAPAAREEAELLRSHGTPLPVHAKPAPNEAAVIEAVAAFASRDRNAVSTSGGLSPRAADAILDSLFSAGGVPPGVATSGEAPKMSSSAAATAYRSNTDIGTYLRWFALFTRYRHTLADELAAIHRAGGFEPLLLCPALIDYDHWLHENVDRSPLPDQVAVMGELARRKTGAVVHGYVAFDPLRQAYHASGKRTAFEPLALVRRAIREMGFLGVKLYPPMGFRPAANGSAACQTYPEWVVRDLAPGGSAPGSDAGCDPRPALGSLAVGRKIDDALAALFDLCVAEDASILAHANESNAAGPHFARRADPAFWIPVFTRWPKLRVCLAHFGHFSSRSTGAKPGERLPAASWEWALGRYLRDARDPPVFADVSYLTEVFDSPAQLDAYARTLKAWIGEFDLECRHLVFGTDWTMLALERSYPDFTRSVHAFFRDRCGFDRDRLDRLLVGNAARLHGLRSKDGARARLEKFYLDHGIPSSRLPRFD